MLQDGCSNNLRLVGPRAGPPGIASQRERLHQRERLRRPDRVAQHNGAVKANNWAGVQREQCVAEPRQMRPVGVFSVGGAGIHRRQFGLQGKSAWLFRSQCIQGALHDERQRRISTGPSDFGVSQFRLAALGRRDQGSECLF